MVRGRKPGIAGLKVSGKTGTANLVIDGQFDLTRQRCSFISVFPSDDPAYLVFILIEDPKPTQDVPYVTGGSVAAPVAQSVIAQASPYLKIPLSTTEQTLEEFSLGQSHIQRRLRLIQQRN